MTTNVYEIQDVQLDCNYKIRVNTYVYIYMNVTVDF